MLLETHIFFVENRTQIILDLIAKINRENPEVRLIVVDMSSFNYPRLGPWLVPGFLGSHSAKVAKMFDALGVEYVDAAKLRPAQQTDFTTEESPKMRRAINSTIMRGYSRGLRLRTRRTLIEVFLNRYLTSQSQKIFSLATELIRELSASKVFVSHENFAAQHATYLAALREGAKPLFYGVSSTADGRFCVQTHRDHDRIKDQNRALEATSTIDDSALQIHSKERLNKIRGGDRFDSLWNQSDTAWKGPRDSLALFATTSSDEMYWSDLDWNEASWENQYEAFQAIWGKLKLRDLTPVLRIHPNLLNKSPSAARREIKEIRRFENNNPEFYIVWPASPVSTYDLISYSDIVIVDNSTVGLEASAAGIPVICSNSSGYDLIADIVTVHGPEDLDKIVNMSTISDPRGAQRYCAYLELGLGSVSGNEFGVRLSSPSRFRQLVPSIIDGSIFSGVFELRWKIYRFIVLVISPKH
jgi:hypothetical protein